MLAGKTPFKIIEKHIIKTGEGAESEESTPSELAKYHKNIMNQISEFLVSKGQIKKVGIASFGPICLDRHNIHYGSIMNTPKKNWVMFNLIKGILGSWKDEIPAVTMDTDVNAVAKFEFSHGGHKAKKNLSYITVGTGIGVGLVINGDTVTGLTHPEGGHIPVTTHSKEFQGFKGVCRFHDNCVEGFSTNVAIAKRFNMDIEELPKIKDDDIVWDIVAHYLAVLCMSITLTCSPEVIVIGGGVMNRLCLYPKIHAEFIKIMNGYISHDLLTEANVAKYIGKFKSYLFINNFLIVRSKFENENGLYSALSLTQ